MSRKGQRFTRTQALPVVVGAYKKEKILRRAKAANPTDLTQDSDDENDSDGAKMAREIERGIAISKMKVTQLRDELRQLNENQTGHKLDL